jgi:hypothetical protein
MYALFLGSSKFVEFFLIHIPINKQSPVELANGNSDPYKKLDNSETGQSGIFEARTKLNFICKYS